jgi:hypothetical protein
MNILSCLPRRKPHPPQTRRALDAGDANHEGEPSAGCGWFDSSHELQRGLVVHEHASVDVPSAELPLASWLELHLSGWSQPAAA